MSKRLQIAEAIKAIVAAARPAADVQGFSDEDSKPDRIGPGGLAIVRSGDPGPAQIDLSPPVYWYEHSFPVELAAYSNADRTSQQILDEWLVAIGVGISANRYLGGLCIWLDADAPTDGETDLRGAEPLGWADFTIIATYSTTSPLG